MANTKEKMLKLKVSEMQDTGVYKCTSWYCKDSKKTYTEDGICFPFSHTPAVLCYDCASGL